MNAWALAADAVLALHIGVVLFVQSLPANITLNGASVEVHGGKTLGDALSASGVKPQPGDLLAVDGSVLEAGKGEPFHATVNGEKVTYRSLAEMLRIKGLMEAELGLGAAAAGYSKAIYPNFRKE